MASSPRPSPPDPPELLTAPGLPGALALSTEAGWNQVLGDWQRVQALWPQGCFCLHAGGVVVSTTAAITYDTRLAWIGMVLTRKDCRGQGFARRLLEHALGFLDAAQVECVKLDATDFGRPVYQKAGFHDERPVSRWLRRKSALSTRPPRMENWLDTNLQETDRKVFGVNRARLVDHLAESGGVFALPGQGYAIVRPGRAALHFGPCVAETHYDAKEIVGGVINRHGREDIVWDLADDNEGAVRLAMESGFQRTRKLMRMYRGRPSPELAHHPKIYALAGFEFG